MNQLLRSFLFALMLSAVPAAIMAAPARGDISEVTQQGVSVEVTHSGIEISSAASETTAVTVYTITGSVVKTFYVQAGTRVTIDLPAGYYIVKTPQRSVRVLVR